MEILSLDPAIPRQRRRIERFLAANGLRLDDIDYYAALTDDSGDRIVAGGGLKDGVIKCVAVADGHKGEAVANTIVSHLIARANAGGRQCVRLYTKPQNRRLFESLSFRLLAEAPEAILMETGIGGIERYSEGLRRTREEADSRCREAADARRGRSGVIVMNANPFTLGHRYLVERSSRLVERLYVVVVREDCSMFSYSERKAMVAQGTGDIGNVVVVDGSDYAVSKTTFPTYFLKRVDDATDTQILLDLDLYRRHIAPPLGASVRFVGTEPSDPLTRRYNELMRRELDEVVELPRLEIGGLAVSASAVRRAIEANDLAESIQLVPLASVPYIIAMLAVRALRAELDTTPKPGLVDMADNGSHRDMDHALMLRGIGALRPYFVRLARLGFSASQPSHGDIAGIGIEAERAMLEATGGVNTHKGALFSVGLAVVAVAGLVANGAEMSPVSMSRAIARLAAGFPDTRGTHGSAAKDKAGSAPQALRGALDNARDGYARLFSSWLPFYADRMRAADAHSMHKTLLRIMCDLDDTNIVYRTSLATMLGVKAEARQMLNRLADGRQKDDLVAEMERMNSDFKALGISPGGSADMLSLVVFLYSVRGVD